MTPRRGAALSAPYFTSGCLRALDLRAWVSSSKPTGRTPDLECCFTRARKSEMAVLPLSSRDCALRLEGLNGLREDEDPHSVVRKS